MYRILTGENRSKLCYTHNDQCFPHSNPPETKLRRLFVLKLHFHQFYYKTNIGHVCVSWNSSRRKQRPITEADRTGLLLPLLAAGVVGGAVPT